MLGAATELNGQVSQRSCPKCNGYLGIVVPGQKAKVPVQAINGVVSNVVIDWRGVLVGGKRLNPARFASASVKS